LLLLGALQATFLFVFGTATSALTTAGRLLAGTSAHVGMMASTIELGSALMLEGLADWARQAFIVGPEKTIQAFLSRSRRFRISSRLGCGRRRKPDGGLSSSSSSSVRFKLTFFLLVLANMFVDEGEDFRLSRAARITVVVVVVVVVHDQAAEQVVKT